MPARTLSRLAMSSRLRGRVFSAVAITSNPTNLQFLTFGVRNTGTRTWRLVEFSQMAAGVAVNLETFASQISVSRYTGSNSFTGGTAVDLNAIRPPHDVATGISVISRPTSFTGTFAQLFEQIATADCLDVPIVKSWTRHGSWPIIRPGEMLHVAQSSPISSSWYDATLYEELLLEELP